MHPGKLATVVCLATLTLSLAGAAQNTVKIGVITSLTGSQAAFGEAHKNGYASAFGPVKFDASGQNQHVVLITQIQGGKYALVHPPSVAVAKPIIPAPLWSKR